MPTPASPRSSRGSASLELEIAPSPRLLLYLAAWGAAAGAAVLDCGGCGAPGRAGLLAALAASLAAGGARLLPLPGFGGVRALRCDDGRWFARSDAGWEPVAIGRATEVLRAGWWLQLRGFDHRRRRHWVWIDSHRTPRASYRALCRGLRRATTRGGVATADAAGRTPGRRRGPGSRRSSRRVERDGD